MGLKERPSDQDWMDLALRFGVEVKSEGAWPLVVQYASALFREVADPKLMLRLGMTDHDNCVFLPVYHQMQPPDRYDRVLVDESQDQSYANRGISELYRKLSTGRIVAVGDSNQAIYAWRGADKDALSEMKKLMTTSGEVETFPLTLCRRCAKVGIELAQKIVPMIQGLDTAPEGEHYVVSEEDFIPELVKRRKGLVLCRANAPLISTCLKLLSMGVPALIARSKIIDDIITLIDNAANGEGGDCPVTKVIEYVENWKAERVAKLSARKGTEDQIQTIMEKADCVFALADGQGIKTASHLKARIGEMFPQGYDLPDPEKMVVLSTVHGAKGSEAETVIMYSPANTKATSLWDAIWSDATDRDNTLYVALTRMQRTIIFAGVPPTLTRFSELGAEPQAPASPVKAPATANPVAVKAKAPRKAKAPVKPTKAKGKAAKK